MGDKSSISARKQKANQQAQVEATSLNTKQIKKTTVRKAGKAAPGAAKKK